MKSMRAPLLKVLSWKMKEDVSSLGICQNNFCIQLYCIFQFLVCVEKDNLVGMVTLKKNSACFPGPPNQEIVPTPMGAVLSHRFANGSERPVAYASQTLTYSEKNYPQVEKEALSLVFAIKKHHEKD